jgi:predicted NBD/HSP70 family sugar kinase
MAKSVASGLKLSERTVCGALARRKLATVGAVAADVGISPSTAVAVLARLVAKGRVFRRELFTGGRGRPSYLYGVKLAGALIAMHWDASRLAGAMFDEDATTLAMEVVSVRSVKSQAEAAAIANELCHSLGQKASRPVESCRGLALSVNAISDADGAIYSSLLPWLDRHVAECFSAASGVLTRLVPHQGLQAEYQLLGDAAPESMVYLHVADGVSGRFTAFGRPYVGQSAREGQLGHITVEANGRRCGCGRRGCLETLCNGLAIVRAAVAAAGKARSPDWLTKAAALRSAPLVVEEIWRNWQQRDRHAIALMDAPLDRLAAAVGVLVNLLDPQQIVAGGYVLQGRQAWLDELRKRSRPFVVHEEHRRLSIVSGRAEVQDLLRSIALSPEAMG